ncbi:MAG: DUF4062 domain-containing protein [Clostridia bacterium]|nr:DUF4062 domain-containing protein [Clostridia bacterium]
MKNIFVSSTFKDMQYERDMLQMVVMPEIDSFSMAYGETVSFTDLRWGINTGDLDTEEGAQKILSVCLDEIDKCRPYMVVLLGERYGWIPNQNLMGRISADRNLEDADLEKSVTALEIEYGAMIDKDRLPYCLFYFRESLPLSNMSDKQASIYASESSLHREKLEKLKKRISSLGGAKVRSYSVSWDSETGRVTGLDNLAAMVEGDIKNLLVQEWGKPSLPTWQEKEENGFLVFMTEKCSVFSARLAEMEKLKQDILLPSTRFMLITGEPGSGKSAMMCKLAESLDLDGRYVCPFICGNGNRSSSSWDLLRLNVYWLENILGIAVSKDSEGSSEKLKTFAEWKTYFSSLLQKYSASEKEILILMADALDQLDENFSEALDWIPDKIPPNVKIVVSNRPAQHMPDKLPEDALVRPLNAVKPDDIDTMINYILSAAHKELDNDIRKEIHTRADAGNPLYLSMLLQRLIMLDSEDFTAIKRLGDDMEAIKFYLREVVRSCPHDLEGMSAALLMEAGERIGPDFASFAMDLLAVSRFGLRISDLASIFTLAGYDFAPLDFSRLRKYMRPYFTERTDGRIDFTHRSIRDGFRALAEDKKDKLQALILQHLKELPATDYVRQSEIIYHLHQADDTEYIVEYFKWAEFAEEDTALPLNELKEICVSEGAQWLISILDNGEALGIDAYFLNQMLFGFYNSFKNSRHEQEILLPIMEAVYRCSGFIQNPLHKREFQAVALSSLAEINDRCRNSDKALELFGESLNLHKQSIIQDLFVLVNLVVAYQQIGRKYAEKSNYEEALQMYFRGLRLATQPNTIFIKAPKDTDSFPEIQIDNYWEHPRLKKLSAVLKVRIADIFHAMGQNEIAECYAAEAAQTLRNIKNETEEDVNSELATALTNLASAQESLQKYSLAENSYTEACRLCCENYDKVGSDEYRMEMLHADLRLASFYEATEKRSEALALLYDIAGPSKALYKRLGTPDAEHLHFCAVRDLGLLLVNIGQVKEAEDFILEAVDMAKNSVKEKSNAAALINLAQATRNMGELLILKKKNEEAVLSFRESLDSIEKAYALDSSFVLLQNYARANVRLAQALMQIRQTVEALGLLEKGVELRRLAAETFASEQSRRFYRSGAAEQAKILLEVGNSSAAFAMIDKLILECKEEYATSKTPFSIASVSCIMRVKSKMHREGEELSEALNVLQQAMEFLGQHNHFDDLTLMEEEAECVSDMAVCYNKLGDANRAIDFYGRAAELCEKQLKLKKNEQVEASLIFALNGAAALLNDAGKSGEAISKYLKAKEVYENMGEAIGTESIISYAVDTFEGFANYHYAQGDKIAAMQNYSKALSLIQSLPLDLNNTDRMNNQATLYSKIGACADASVRRGYFEKAKEILLRIDEQTNHTNNMYKSNLEWVIDVLAHI